MNMELAMQDLILAIEMERMPKGLLLYYLNPSSWLFGWINW